MSNANAQFIEDWNANLIFKIRNSDLERPTETFLIKALSSLLTAMGIEDCYTLKIYCENKTESQLAKASFQKYIDSLYKIADEKNNFVYYDLIDPTPKKTFHLLQHLLNYYFFYKMMKNNLLERVSSKLKKRDNLMSELNDLKIHIEASKMQKETMEGKLKELKKQVVALKKEHPILKATAEKQMKEIASLKSTMEQVNARITDANRMIELHADEIIDEDEVKNLLATKEECERQQESLKERQTSIHNRLADTFRLKHELEIMFKVIDKIADCLDTNDAMEIKIKHSNLQKELDEIEETIQKIQADIENIKVQHTLNVEMIQNSIRQSKATLEAKKQELIKLNAEYEENEAELIKEQLKFHTAEKSLEESKEDLEAVIVSGVQVLAVISKTENIIME